MEKKISHCYCRDFNLQPFNHESSAVTPELSPQSDHNMPLQPYPLSPGVIQLKNQQGSTPPGTTSTELAQWAMLRGCRLSRTEPTCVTQWHCCLAMSVIVLDNF